ncbi:MAG: glycogen debranching protein GlgX, partial [Geminicoccaceae bacterium]
PMLLAGDELANSQKGNNNAYCQDKEIGWLAGHRPEGGLDGDGSDEIAFVQRLIAFRKAHPVLRRGRFFHGRTVSPDGLKDVTWLSPDGREKTAEHWTNGWARSIGLMLAGDAGDDRDQRGRPLKDDVLLIMLNAHHDNVDFVLPKPGARGIWRLEIDTALPDLDPNDMAGRAGGDSISVTGRSVLVWRLDKAS